MQNCSKPSSNKNLQAFFNSSFEIFACNFFSIHSSFKGSLNTKFFPLKAFMASRGAVLMALSYNNSFI